MYKYTHTTYMQNPPSLGGNWDSGTYTVVNFSRSPKKACEGRGVRVCSMSGVEGCPIMELRRLERDGKLIFEEWCWTAVQGRSAVAQIIC
jgi:hypothetical protein